MIFSKNRSIICNNKHFKGRDMVDNESQEMYLETILKLSVKKGNVRSVDVAEELRYSKPSVSALAGDFMSGSVTTKIFKKHLTKTLDKEFCGVYNKNAKGKSGINRL